MPLSGFHPITRRWFAETLGTPTPAQARGWAALRERRHTLIAAPTGSGKTLAAFLTALDDLVVEGLETPLPDEVRVVYVSPLKALSTDIHKNLTEPREGLARLGAPRITAAVRTGDTTTAERAAMIRTPPHILVTTPESLYLLLTAERSREMLRTVRTVIVDEIHAVIGTRRGAHLALTLERLQRVAERPLIRLGLSATQKPIEEVARWLCGQSAGDATAALPPAIVDEGHRRAMDLRLALPRSPLEAVMSAEVWNEYYDVLTELIAAHDTTLVFVNTRRMAERVARHLADRLGDDAVTAHHGSLSKENRLDAETRLKSGTLKALVATASLELGIDIGSVDLVCQLGSPHRIATFLQRVGRSGHSVAGLPKGRLFPVSLDDLVECAALLRAVQRGDLDRIVVHDMPLDVLAQQIVAEAAAYDSPEEDLYALVKRAWPYRELKREDFDAVVKMTSEGFATKRGRRGALLHRDEVNGAVRGRRGTRTLAITSGGAIPEVADYRVVLEPEETFIGTLNEDFAIESMAGDVFQLGNTSWRITQVLSGVVRVTDARGEPPSIPFWFGEAPARSDELSRAVSDLRADVDAWLERVDESSSRPVVESSGRPVVESSCRPVDESSSRPVVESSSRRVVESPSRPVDESSSRPVVESSSRPVVESSSRRDEESRRLEGSKTRRLEDSPLAFLDSPAATAEITQYLEASRRALGVLPTQDTLVLERFFDEAGGMQLVLHAPFGSRINRAWGLALRKRFCRQFNFELQAAATEDAILLSLGPQHSFPLADVFRYLHPNTAKDVLVQAFLDAPVFKTRWRWNTTISLAVPRNRNGNKVAPQLQRMMADDLMAAVFPDAAACFENIPGDRQIPDHPLVSQVVRDCLEEAMDFDGLARVLTRIHANEIRLVARDTPEPSPLAYEILNAKPYAFLDDAPLEERRTQAVLTRRGGEVKEFGALDAAAIARVREEERPDPRDADELHDALLTAGFLLEDEVDRSLFEALECAGRACAFESGGAPPLSDRTAGVPPADVHASRVHLRGRDAHASAAGTAAVRGVLETGRAASSLHIAAERLPELLAIHDVPTTIVPPASRRKSWTRGDAVVELLRGRISILGPTTARELASSLRIDEREAEAALLKLESEGVVLRGHFSAPDQWCDRRLLARIHRYTLNRLRAEIEPVGAADFMRFLFAWQHVAAASKLTGIDGLQAVIAQLDGFEVAATAWERSILPARIDGYEPSLLDMLCLAGEVGWARLSPAQTSVVGATPIALFLREHADAWQSLRGDSEIVMSDRARAVLDVLRAKGACFARDLGNDGEALAELVSAGLIASDGFAGLRTLISPNARASFAGRWSLLAGAQADDAVETQARVLLRRYGIVFRRMLTREPNAVPWRDLARVYRRLEARGEIRGGRFVHGMSGEQFALPEAIERMREIRRETPDGTLIVLSAADPLNLTGIITADERVRAVAGTRIAWRDGVAVSVMEGDYVRPLVEATPEIAAALAGRRVAVAQGWVGR